MYLTKLNIQTLSSMLILLTAMIGNASEESRHLSDDNTKRVPKRAMVHHPSTTSDYSEELERYDRSSFQRQPPKKRF